MVNIRLKGYAIMGAVFLCGTVTGVGATYAWSQKHVAELLSHRRPELMERWRLHAMAHALDLNETQRLALKTIMHKHAPERKALLQATFERCGQGLSEHKMRMGSEIKTLLNPVQQKRFDAITSQTPPHLLWRHPGPNQPSQPLF